MELVVGSSSGPEGWCQQVPGVLPVCACVCMDGVVREWVVNTLPFPMIAACVVVVAFCSDHSLLCECVRRRR